MSAERECLSDFLMGCFEGTNIAWTKRRPCKAYFSELYIECE